MIHLLKFGNKQKAVYWAAPVVDGYGGYTFTTAVELDVRWEARNEWYTDTQGNEALSRGVVYVNQVLMIGGYLKLGLLISLDSTALTNPKNDPLAYQIKSFNDTPDRRARSFARVAYL